MFYFTVRSVRSKLSKEYSCSKENSHGTKLTTTRGKNDV